MKNSELTNLFFNWGLLITIVIWRVGKILLHVHLHVYSSHDYIIFLCFNPPTYACFSNCWLLMSCYLWIIAQIMFVLHGWNLFLHIQNNIAVAKFCVHVLMIQCCYVILYVYSIFCM